MADSVFRILFEANAAPVVAAAQQVQKALHSAASGPGNAINQNAGQNLARANAQVNALNRAMQQSAGFAGNLASTLGRAPAAALSVGTSIGRGIITPLTRAIGLAGRLGSTLRRSVASVGGKLGGAVGGAVGGIGALAKGAGLVTSVFGVSAIREAISFQDQLAKINTIAKLDSKTFQDFLANGTISLHGLGKQLQDRAEQYGISIEDMTSAEYEFLSAGIGVFTTYHNGAVRQVTDFKQQGQALDAASKLSIAGLSSQTEAVTLLSFALNAFNLNQKTFNDKTAQEAGVIDSISGKTTRFAHTMGDAANVIADQFAKAIEIGVVTGPQIARSFATVAASAKVAGIGIDEISAAYASQTVRGVSAARVTTSMNRAIQDLIKPGKQLVGLMAKTHQNYAQIAKTQGIHVALQQMRTDANKAGIEYATLFKRQEGWRFALNITQDNLKDASGNFRLYQAVLEEVRHSSDGTGTATEQMDERMHTVGRELSRLRIGFKILQQSIGEPLLRPFADFVRALTGLEVQLYNLARTDAGRKFVEQMGPIIGIVGGLLALTAGTQGLLFALQPIAPLLGTTATNMRGLAVVMGKFVGPLAIIIGLLGTFRFLVENNIRGFGKFQRQLSDMEQLAAGVINVFKTIGASIRYVWDVIGQGGDVSAAISQSLDAIGQSVEDLGPPLVKVSQFILSFFVSLGQGIVSALSKAVPAIANWFVSVAAAIAPKAATLLGMFVGWAARVVPQILAALGTFAREFARWVQQAVPYVIAGLGVLLRAFIDWASSVVPSVVRALGDFTSAFAGWAARAVPSVVRALGDIGTAFVKWASGVVPKIISALGNFAAEFVGWVRSVLPSVGRALGDFVSAVQDWLRTNGPRIVDALSTWASQIAAWFANDLFPSVQKGISKFLDSVVAFLQDTQIIRKLVNFLVTAIAGIAAFLASHAGEIVAVFVEIARQAIAGFGDFIKAHGGELLAAGVAAGGKIVSGIASYIANNPGEVIKALATMWLLAAAAGAVLSALSAVRDVFISNLAGSATQSLLSRALVTVLQGAWGSAQAAVRVAVGVAGAAAGLVYAGAVKVGQILIGALTALWAFMAGSPAVLGAAGGAGAAAGAAYSAGTEGAILLGSGVEDALIVVSSRQSLLQTIYNIGFKFGELLGTALNLALGAIDFAKDLVAPLTTRLSAVMEAVGLSAGAVGAAALTAGLVAAAIVIPVGIALFITSKLSEGDQNFENQVKQLVDNAMASGTAKDLQDAKQYLQQQIDKANKRVQITGGGIGYDSALQALNDLKAKSVELDAFVAKNQQAIQQNVANTSKSFDKLSVKRPPLPISTFVVPPKVSDAQLAVDSFTNAFNAGFNNLTLNLPTFDWHNVLKVGDEKKSAAEIASDIDATFQKLNASLTTNTGDISSKLGAFSTKTFKSNGARIAEVNKALDIAQKKLKAAQAAHDSVSTIQLLQIISDLNTQKTALRNAGTVVGQSASDLAKQNAAIQTTLSTVGSKTAPDNFGTPTNDETNRYQKYYNKIHTQLANMTKLRGAWVTEQRKWAALGETNPFGTGAAGFSKFVDSNPLDIPVPKVPTPTIGPKGKTQGITYDQWLAKTFGKQIVVPAPVITPPDTTAETTALTNAATQAITSVNSVSTAATTAVANTTATLATVTPTAKAAGTRVPDAVAAGIGANMVPVTSASNTVTGAIDTVIRNYLPVAAGLGGDLVNRLASGISDAVGAVTSATSVVLAALTGAFSGVSWYQDGANMVDSLISGIKSKLPDVSGASLAVAQHVGKYAKASSPPKLGPLHNLPKWGAEYVNQLSIGMMSSLGLVTAASLATAGAVAGPMKNTKIPLPTFAQAPVMAGGAREIAPMAMGWHGGGSGGGYTADSEHQSRQTELLAEIASATRLGAAASAHGASRDPRAGGPMAARSALVSLKQMTTSRTRAGS